jgi:hypothetical protein
VNRMNFALSMAANRLPGISIAWDPTETANNDMATLESNPSAPDPQVEESRLEALLVTGGISDSTRAAVLQQFEQQKEQNTAAAVPVGAPERRKFRARAVTETEKQDQLLAGLLLGSPEFQRR